MSPHIGLTCPGHHLTACPGCRFIFLTGLNLKNYLIDLEMKIYGYFELGLISLNGMWETSPGSEMAVNLNQEETERGSKLQ